MTAYSFTSKDFDRLGATNISPKEGIPRVVRTWEGLGKKYISRSSKRGEVEAKDMDTVKTYVKMRSTLFETYAVVAAFFTSIGIAVYYDSVAEEWIALRDDYLVENGYQVSRTLIEISKVFACAGVLHSILAMIVIVIGLVFMTRLSKMFSTAEFMFNSKIWFFGWDCWDSHVARIANFNLSAALICFITASICDVYNRVDTPYTYILGFSALPLLGYIIYFLYMTKKHWDEGYKAEATKVSNAVLELEDIFSSTEKL